MKTTLVFLLLVVPWQTPRLFLVGTVVDVNTSRPIAGAIVALTRVADGSRQEVLRTKTDPAGRFLFEDLASAHQFDVSASGYLPLVRPVPIALSQSANLGVIALTPYKQIAGSLTDDRGIPLSGVTVSAFASDIRRETEPVLAATTDDQGRYAIDRVPPGSYTVCAVSTAVSVSRKIASGFGGGRIGDAPLIAVAGGDIQASLQGQRQPSPLALEIEGGRPILAPTSCYPAGADLLSAGSVSIAANDRNDVDIVATRRPTANVQGRVIPLPGRSVGGTEIRLVPSAVDEARAEAHLDAALTEVGNDGAFSFIGVVPGSYRLRLELEHKESAGIAYDFVSELVTVGDTDLSGISAPMRAGLRLTGSLEFWGRFPNTPIGGLTIQLEMAKIRTDRWPNVRLRTVTDATGRFAFAGLLPGVYRIISQLPRGQGLSGITVSGRSLAGNVVELRDELSVEVVATDAAAAVEVSAEDAGGRPVETRDAWIFPADHEAWRDAWSDRLRFQSVPLAGPTTQIAGLPPGRYLVALVDRLNGNHSWNASALSLLEHNASAVELRAGEAARVHVKGAGK